MLTSRYPSAAELKAFTTRSGILSLFFELMIIMKKSHPFGSSCLRVLIENYRCSILGCQVEVVFPKTPCNCRINVRAIPNCV